MTRPLPEGLQAWLAGQLPGELELLRQMVETNSFTNNRTGVQAVSALTAQAFSELGFEASEVPSNNPGHGDHLILRRSGGNRVKIGLVTHLDTVFTSEEERAHQFSWSVEGDRIHGPGTHDIKGGTIMIHLVLRALQRFYPTLFERVDWIILADAHEEQRAEDFGALCLRELSGAQACLIFEGGAKKGSEFSLVVARKGRAEFAISVEGRSAHAGGSHQRGVNAITQLAYLIPTVSKLTDYGRELTINVGVVHGGTVLNRVPDQARLEGEIRAFDPGILEEACQRVLGIPALSGSVLPLESSAFDGVSAQIRSEIIHETPAWPRNPATDRLYAVWAEAADLLGFTVIPESRGGLSDGNYVVGEIPTLDGLGPSGANDHCAERAPNQNKDSEYVEISSFVPKALLNIVAIEVLLTDFPGPGAA